MTRVRFSGKRLIRKWGEVLRSAFCLDLGGFELYNASGKDVKVSVLQEDDPDKAGKFMIMIEEVN